MDHTRYRLQFGIIFYALVERGQVEDVFRFFFLVVERTIVHVVKTRRCYEIGD